MSVGSCRKIELLKLIYNNNDDVSLSRVINTPKRGIGAKTIEQLALTANITGSSMFDSIVSGKELKFKEEETAIEELKDVITGIRNVRAKMNVHT